MDDLEMFRGGSREAESAVVDSPAPEGPSLEPGPSEPGPSEPGPSEVRPSDDAAEATRPVLPTVEESPSPLSAAGGASRVVGRKLVAVALLSGLVGGAVGAFAAGRGEGALTVERVATPVASAAGQERLSGVAAVAQKVMPSIVRIDVEGLAGPFGRTGEGTGSGVIFSSDGYIVTNDHVVDGATSLQVTLSTGEKLTARRVGTAAPGDDIAVIKVEKTGLPAATLGSTSGLSVGDLAVAVGSPFGLQGTVTAGVISALHRNIDLGGEHLTDAIQTDAPINPGNSGGALADANGNVVGINTAILGTGTGNAGVGFAIPIDIARRDAEQIIRTGRAERPFLGISGENLPNGGGALIQEVVTGGPAADAGLRAGDVVVRLDDATVGSMEDLIAELSKREPGQTVRLRYRRSGRTLTTRATLSARPG